MQKYHISPVKPFNQIECLKCGPFDWLSLGADPQFLWSGRLPFHGWNMIELGLDLEISSTKVTIYFDIGKGFGDENSVTLQIKNGGIGKRICYLPRNLRRIRLDPLEFKGKFSIRHFRIVWLPPWFAYNRLANRLVNRHHRYRDMQKSEVIKDIKIESREDGIRWQTLALNRYDETFVNLQATLSYSDWIELVEKSRIKNVGEVIRRINKFTKLPLISLLLPAYNTNLKFLAECLDSLLGQAYRNWQLCVVYDPTKNPNVSELLHSYASRDHRIKFKSELLSGNKAEAINSSLALAEGEYFALLHHDDLLANHALTRAAETIIKNPEAELIYSDEDRFNSEWSRFKPHFKPDWNPDLLLSHNYICNFTLLRTERVRQLGGFCLDLEDNHDYDLLLRYTLSLSPNQILHIPEILYHRRYIDGPTTSDFKQENLQNTEDLIVLKNYFENQAIPAKAERGLLPNTYRIRWSLPTPPPLVSLLIPTRDGFEILSQCIQSILKKTSYPNYEVLILDNQSTCKRTLEFLDQIKSDNRVSVHKWDKPFNYSAINNFGVTLARGEILGLLNNDIEVINSDWLDEMASHAYRPDIGCVGAKLYYPNETIQHSGVILGIGGVAGHAHRYFSRNDNGYSLRLKLVQNLSAVTAACLLVRKSVFNQVQGLNEEHLTVAFNDVDFCLKVREAGYRNLWTPYAELYHHESISRGADDTTKKRKRAEGETRYMRLRWGEKLDADPAYNPNLTLLHEDFSLRSA